MQTATKRLSECVYYWVGGTESGKWHTAICLESTAVELERAIQKQGYATRRGSEKVGPPEGAPRELGGRR